MRDWVLGRTTSLSPKAVASPFPKLRHFERIDPKERPRLDFSKHPTQSTPGSLGAAARSRGSNRWQISTSLGAAQGSVSRGDANAVGHLDGESSPDTAGQKQRSCRCLTKKHSGEVLEEHHCHATDLPVSLAQSWLFDLATAATCRCEEVLQWHLAGLAVVLSSL